MDVIKIFLIILCLLEVDSLIIDCDFKYEYIHDWNERYTCRTRNLNSKIDNKNIESISGVHLESMSNDNVTQYFARLLTVEYFPNGLGDYFSNLEVVRITSCNMRHLRKKDLQNLRNLKYLDLIGNKIEKLDSNTFENTPQLQNVILNNNRLQFIGSKLMEPLKNLQIISFGGNTCIGGHAKDSVEQLERLKTEIKLKCNDISMEDLMQKMDNLEMQIKKILIHVLNLSQSLKPDLDNSIE